MKNPFFLITVFIVGCIQQPKTIHQLESEKNRNTPVVNISKVRLGLDLLLDEKIILVDEKIFFWMIHGFRKMKMIMRPSMILDIKYQSW